MGLAQISRIRLFLPKIFKFCTAMASFWFVDLLQGLIWRLFWNPESHFEQGLLILSIILYLFGCWMTNLVDNLILIRLSTWKYEQLQPTVRSTWRHPQALVPLIKSIQRPLMVACMALVEHVFLPCGSHPLLRFCKERSGDVSQKKRILFTKKIMSRHVTLNLFRNPCKYRIIYSKYLSFNLTVRSFELKIYSVKINLHY